MIYLLDTCTLIWLVNDSQELSLEARRACKDAKRLHVSAVSAWEMALKHARGKLALQGPIATWWKLVVDGHGLIDLPVTAEIALGSTSLPPIHTDPADRLLIATAQRHQLVLITPDRTITKYPDLKTVW